MLVYVGHKTSKVKSIGIPCSNLPNTQLPVTPTADQYCLPRTPPSDFPHRIAAPHVGEMPKAGTFTLGERLPLICAGRHAGCTVVVCSGRRPRSARSGRRRSDNVQRPYSCLVALETVEVGARRRVEYVYHGCGHANDEVLRIHGNGRDDAFVRGNVVLEDSAAVQPVCLYSLALSRTVKDRRTYG